MLEVERFGVKAERKMGRKERVRGRAKEACQQDGKIVFGDGKGGGLRRCWLRTEWREVVASLPSCAALESRRLFSGLGTVVEGGDNGGIER